LPKILLENKIKNFGHEIV